MSHLELSIALARHNGAVLVDLRLYDALNAVGSTIASAQRVPLDLELLRGLQLSPDEYGRQLTEMLFAEQAARQAWEQAVAFARGAGRPLRVRLQLEAAADELHDICWELLRAPLTDRPLATSPEQLLARYLDAADLTPVRIPPGGSALRSPSPGLRLYTL